MTTDLDAPFPLASDAAEAYRANGFVHLRGVLGPPTLERFGREITAGVRDLNTLDRPMEERTTYEKAFLQVMNLWRGREPCALSCSAGASRGSPPS